MADTSPPGGSRIPPGRDSLAARFQQLWPSPGAAEITAVAIHCVDDELGEEDRGGDGGSPSR